MPKKNKPAKSGVQVNNEALEQIGRHFAQEIADKLAAALDEPPAKKPHKRRTQKKPS